MPSRARPDPDRAAEHLRIRPSTVTIAQHDSLFPTLLLGSNTTAMAKRIWSFRGEPRNGAIRSWSRNVARYDENCCGARMVSDTQGLIAGLTEGRERALTELYDRFGGAVYSLAFRVTGDRGAAEEISLDTFLQVWQQAARFNADQGSLQSWLFTIARSRAIDRVRAAKAVKRTQAEDSAAEQHVERPDETVELAERRRLVRQAITGLTPSQRAALELAYFEGLSHAQIAERLGEPLGTVKTRVRQAMIALRRTLGPALATP
jgi:RNA polymerase sigma-70 factor, ECF subfamily